MSHRAAPPVSQTGIPYGGRYLGSQGHRVRLTVWDPARILPHSSDEMKLTKVLEQSGINKSSYYLQIWPSKYVDGAVCLLYLCGDLSFLPSEVHAFSVTDSPLNAHSVPLCARRLPWEKYSQSHIKGNAIVNLFSRLWHDTNLLPLTLPRQLALKLFRKYSCPVDS